MNLHAIAAGYAGAVNPNLPVTIRPSQGYTTGPSGKQSPSYGEPYCAFGQVQALTYTDLRQVDGLNLTGIRRAIYLTGHAGGIVRPRHRGGDLVIFPDGSTWLVAMVLEDWNPQDGWVKVVVTLQDRS